MDTKIIWYFVIIILFILGCLIYKVREISREKKIQIDESFSQLLRKNHQIHMKYRKHMPKIVAKKLKIKRLLNPVIRRIYSLYFWTKHSSFLSRARYYWNVFFWGQS